MCKYALLFVDGIVIKMHRRFLHVLHSALIIKAPAKINVKHSCMYATYRDASLDIKSVNVDVEIWHIGADRLDIKTRK